MFLVTVILSTALTTVVLIVVANIVVLLSLFEILASHCGRYGRLVVGRQLRRRMQTR